MERRASGPRSPARAWDGVRQLAVLVAGNMRDEILAHFENFAKLQGDTRVDESIVDAAIIGASQWYFSKTSATETAIRDYCSFTQMVYTFPEENRSGDLPATYLRRCLLALDEVSLRVRAPALVEALRLRC